MRYAYKTVVINPIIPVRQAGHIQQVNPVSKVNDNLNARIIAIEDDNNIFINVSCDTLGFKIEFQNKLTELIKPLFDKPVTLVVSATHTHYAGDTQVDTYFYQCLNTIYKGISELEFKQGNLKVSYKSIPYQGVGTSRISNHEACVLLNLVQIFDDNKEIIDIINYNCHPTILSAVDTDYFSSEYVGYALSKLDDCYYTFLQGAAGDVSTRFTRSGQHYPDVIELGDKFVKAVKELKNQPCNLVDLKLDLDKKELNVTHEFTELDLSNIPSNLTDRELETIGYGKISRKNLQEHPETLQTNLTINKVGLGNVNMIFAPNELFSYYLSILDTSKAFVACYSNGYSPYVTPINEFLLTYESFTDVLSKQTKQELIDTIKSFN